MRGANKLTIVISYTWLLCFSLHILTIQFRFYGYHFMGKEGNSGRRTLCCPLCKTTLDHRPFNFHLQNPGDPSIFQELGFCVHVKYPHKIIIIILSLMLEQSQNTELVQLSWNFMNDSLRSDVFMRYTPDQIGCASIWLSARIKKVPFHSLPSILD